MGDADVEFGLGARGERGDLSDPDEGRPVELRHLASKVHSDPEAPLIGCDQRRDHSARDWPKRLPARRNGERQRNQGRGVDADDLTEERHALRRLADENPGEPQRAF
jgi:hypothetical protein